MKGNCLICKKEFSGRAGKKFCSQHCKNEYNIKLRKATNTATTRIDAILHRNRSILLEIMGKASTQKKVQRALLDAKKFNYGYITHFHINSQNKFVHYVYDFSWIIFSDQEILLKRIGSNTSEIK